MNVADEIIKATGLEEFRDKDKAECIGYAWCLKTKLYLIGETLKKWSKEEFEMLKHEVNCINDMLKSIKNSIRREKLNELD
jgi:predicted RNA-binding protein